ncbi:MAG TPA: hypothetical protein VGN69_10905 [Solirubrobacteraceae bacterium]|nr:hypothetical protein [Solirubrobacteraceae bacterium]
MGFENVLFLWQQGERRLAQAPTEQAPVLERVCERILEQLRRRLGGTFLSDELEALYREGTDWCLAVAIEAAPDSPWAWEARTVTDAAFARYLREAADFAGGRRSAPTTG